MREAERVSSKGDETNDKKDVELRKREKSVMYYHSFMALPLYSNAI
jgi:hypothetical protein